RGAEARRRSVPAERGTRRQDARDRPAACAGDGLSPGDRAGAIAEGGDRRVRRNAGRTQGDAGASGAAQRHDGARRIQSRRRRRMGHAAHALPRWRGTARSRIGRGTEMVTVGNGDYVYEPVVDWAKLPPGWSFKEIGSVGVDKNDNVYVFNLGEHPEVLCARER